tara:strand:+ start:1089 stop:2114 length:1026 start_codon:yes stop_codon:yes gene_type:complete
MSRIRANKVTNKLGTGAVELEKGAHLPIGMGITGAGGLNISGVVTATSFSGSGANLTGIDATSIKDSGGNVKIQAQASGAVYTGIHTFTTLNSTNFGAVSGTTGTFSGNVSVGGVLTYEDVTNIDSVGIVTAREGIFIPDTKELKIGNTAGSPDLKIYHSGSHSYIANVGTGELVIQAKSGENGAVFRTDGASELYYNDSKKIETTSSGVTVTGTVAATALTGDGSGITGIAVGLSTEALVKTNGQTATLDLSNDDHKLTATGSVTVTTTGGTEGDSHTLRIENNGTASVSFSSFFKFPSGAAPSLPTSSGAISLVSFTIHKAGAVGINTILLGGVSINYS